jgi:hypothetical protein
MDALIPIIVGFILTGLIGNRLLQQWQARNWFLQQRFLGHEKEYIALKELADEIASLLGIRLFRMRRLNRVLSSGDFEQIKDRSREYDESLKRWNERLTSFYIRLPMLADYGLTWRLEHKIQHELVRIGGNLENLAKERLAGKSITKGAPSSIEAELNQVQGKSITLTKELLAELRTRRTDVYYGKRLPFSPENLRHFSTWQLIKALFVRDIDSLSVVRALLDT